MDSYPAFFLILQRYCSGAFYDLGDAESVLISHKSHFG